MLMSREKITSERAFDMLQGVRCRVMRFAPHPPAKKARFAGAYMLVNAAAVAALNNLFEPVDTTKVMHLSWVTIVILLFSISTLSRYSSVVPVCRGTKPAAMAAKP